MVTLFEQFQKFMMIFGGLRLKACLHLVVLSPEKENQEKERQPVG